MATVKDKPLDREDTIEDNKTFVLNWLSDAPPTNNKYDSNTIATRIEDILDELRSDNGHTTIKIRLR